MTPAELKEKQIAIEASIRTLEEQLETAKNHQRELFVLEADLVITKDIQSGVHAAAQANRAAQEALDETDNALQYPEGDPINDIDPPAVPPTEE
tara:strand:- start:184 stop:465 length:282 start_codon:yes stop_codon:yes gene_type:complete